MFATLSSRLGVSHHWRNSGNIHSDQYRGIFTWPMLVRNLCPGCNNLSLKRPWKIDIISPSEFKSNPRRLCILLFKSIIHLWYLSFEHNSLSASLAPAMQQKGVCKVMCQAMDSYKIFIQCIVCLAMAWTICETSKVMSSHWEIEIFVVKTPTHLSEIT